MVMNYNIRQANINDLDALVEIENRAFTIDRFNRRSFRYLLSKANAVTLVAENEHVFGYIMLLFNMGTSLARIYSFALDPAYQGLGIGRALLEAIEQHAVQHDCVAIRLEVRFDNEKAIKMYKATGYRDIKHLHEYYEDHADALRFEKSLAPYLKPAVTAVPYYAQTLDFTCGPACLMMALKAHQPELTLDRSLELRLWRESTTIFMTSGHGGCGPYGLALAASRRGLGVSVYVNDLGAMFMDSVRSAEKKEVIRLVHEDFLKDLQNTPVEIKQESLDVDGLETIFNNGGICIVLISSYRMYGEKFPHWVVVTGFAEKFIYLHDPFVDTDVGKTLTDCISMPVLKRDFSKMTQYGKAGQKAVVVIYKE